MTDNVETHASETDPPIPFRKKSIWTDDLVARLKHYAGSLSCKEISLTLSDEFGTRITRNMVISKMSRIGCGGRRRPHYHGPKPELSEAAAMREKAKRIRAPRQPRSKLKLRVIECAPRAIGLMDLEADECRYPVNESAEASGHLFCGLPTKSGVSWCAQHASLIFVPPKIRSRVKEAA